MGQGSCLNLDASPACQLMTDPGLLGLRKAAYRPDHGSIMAVCHRSIELTLPNHMSISPYRLYVLLRHAIERHRRVTTTCCFRAVLSHPSRLVHTSHTSESTQPAECFNAYNNGSTWV